MVFFSLIVGGALFLFPYKITNFMILDSENVQSSREFLQALLSAGIFLLGLYFTIKGSLYWVREMAFYLNVEQSLRQLDDYKPKKIAAFWSHIAQIIIGVVIMLKAKWVARKFAK